MGTENPANAVFLIGDYRPELVIPETVLYVSKAAETDVPAQ